MAATRVGNVIEMNADGDTLQDLYSAGDLAGLSFKSMVLSASAAGAVILETDRGSDTTFGTINLSIGVPVVIPGPLNFVDGLKIGATPPAGLSLLLFM